MNKKEEALRLVSAMMEVKAYAAWFFRNIFYEKQHQETKLRKTFRYLALSTAE